VKDILLNCRHNYCYITRVKATIVYVLNYDGEPQIIRNVDTVHVVQMVTLLVGYDAIRVVYLSPTVVVQKEPDAVCLSPSSCLMLVGPFLNLSIHS
jgi:hypothetical protein